MTMTNRPNRQMFGSARDKLDRARHHFSDLQQELVAYKSLNPFDIRAVVLDDRVEIRVAVRVPIPPIVTLVAGDCIHNLRSALDHIAYESVAKVGTSNCDFPIWTREGSDFSQSEWRKLVRAKVPGGNAASLRRYLEAIRPLRGGADEYLWSLHRLDIFDKHRLLLAVYATTEFITAVTSAHGVEVNEDGTEVHVPNIGEVEARFIPATQFPIEDGTVLAEFTTEEYADLRSFKPLLSIALAEPETLAGHDLESAIDELIEKIDGLIDDVEAFLRPPLTSSSPMNPTSITGGSS